MDAGDSEGGVEVGGAGGDAVGVSAAGPGDGGFETGEAAGGVKGAGAGGFTGAAVGGFEGGAAGPCAKEATASDIRTNARTGKREDATAIFTTARSRSRL